MPNFESGVASYIIGQATVKVFFPVEAKGREAINCRQCQFLSSNERFEFAGVEFVKLEELVNRV